MTDGEIGAGGLDAAASDRLLASAVRQDHFPVAITDTSLVVVYANDSCRNYGHEPSDLIGTNILDLVHPDEVERAAAAATVIDSGLELRPAPYHLRQGDGTYVVLEVLLSLVGDGERTTHFVFTLRPSPFRDAHAKALGQMVSGGPLADSLALVVSEFSPHRPPGVVALDEGDRRVTIGPMRGELVGVFDGRQDTTPGAPWTRAMATDRPVIVESLDGLPSRAAAVAVELGMRGGVVFAVRDPGGDQPALVSAWVSTDANLEIISFNLGDVSDLVQLALERRATQRHLEHLAHHDPLTGLGNRALFFDVLGGAVGPHAGRGSVAVIYLDLDGFKEVNDKHGHRAGDRTLAEVARRFRDSVRSHDVVARVGGDEFVVFVPRPTGSDEVLGIAGRLADAAREPVEVDGASVRVGASAGVAYAHDASRHDADDLVRVADDALYRAKRSGRGVVEHTVLD